MKAAGGTGSAPVVTANDAVAPDGTTTADLIVFDRGAGNTATDRSDLTQTITVVNATAYSGSVFLKAATAGDIGKQLAFRHVEATAYNVITLTADWVRYERAQTSTSTSNIFRLANIGSVTADNTVSAHVWQAQLETGSVATSPIVTTAGTANRVADSVTLASASSLIGQTQGTLYVEYERLNFSPSVAQRIFGVSDGSNTNRIQMFIATTGAQDLVVTASGSLQALIGTAGVISGISKGAVAYATNDIALYRNGVSTGTDTSAIIPACNRVNIGTSETGSGGTDSFLGWIRSVALFPTRLPNATLQSLTS